ncbi:MAG TPA: thermonuclease family protein [Chitinophagaceae bacterium]
MKHNLKQTTTPLLFFLLYVLLLSCNQQKHKKKDQPNSYAASANSGEEKPGDGKVIRIKDGDTFVLLINGKEQVLRLAHIDCPEKKQAFAGNAKQFASDLCLAKYVTLIHNNKYDRDKRLIAEVLLPDGRNVNKEMVRNGFAWHFKKYSNSNEYAQLEMEAKANKRGLWIDPDPIAPWSWRKQ